jgi:regulator of RNase E activity RraA
MSSADSHPAVAPSSRVSDSVRNGAGLLQLKRWNTPTIFNGWEQITKRYGEHACCNREETCDFMPQMGPMVGYAVTVVFQPGNPRHRETNPRAWHEYYAYVASIPGPKIAVVQDLDKPNVIGAFWGEVNSNVHRSLGCVGTITDGAIRDWDEMCNAGFKALARRFCVGHGYSIPIRWNCEVEVFGTKIVPGQLVHADKHGFLAVPKEDEAGLLEAARFMDANECQTVIPAARGGDGKTFDEILESLEKAGQQFRKNATKRFGHAGEW